MADPNIVQRMSFGSGPGQGFSAGKLTDFQQQARVAWTTIADTVPGSHQLAVISVTPFKGSQMHSVFAVDPASEGWVAPADADQGRVTGTWRP